jgi:hypothetical protein
VSSLRDPIAYDSFWHLKTGEDWVELGYSPFEDHYSITHSGQPIITQPYLFQASLHGFVKHFGLETGYKLVVFIGMACAAFMLLIWLRSINAPILVAAAALAAVVVVMQVRAQVRPELFAYSLLIFCLMVYSWVRAQPSPKRLMLVALTMLLFTNYHSAILGYVIFFGLFVDLAVDQIRKRASTSEWLTWAIWGAIVVAVGFLNPTFNHPVIVSLGFSSEWLDLITEYRSPWQGRNGFIVFGLVLMGILTIAAFLRLGLFGYSIVCGIFAWYTSRYGRLIAPGGIVLISLFALAITMLDRLKPVHGHERRMRALITAVCLAIFIVSISASVSKARSLVQANQSLAGYFPQSMVEYMKAREKEGRIFNDFSIGGFLIYHLGDTSKVYVDGRTAILYPVAHVQSWIQANTDPDLMRSLISEHEIDFVIVQNGLTQMRVMGAIEEMNLDFVDLRYSLFAQGQANFPILGDMWSQPSCWFTDSEALVQAEQNLAVSILPESSPLLPFAYLAADFAAAPDKNDFLHSVQDSDKYLRNDVNSRFMAHRALQIGEDELAVEFFSRVRGQQASDLLASGIALVRSGELQQGYRLLNTVAQRTQARPDSATVQLLRTTLAEILASGDLHPDFRDALVEINDRLPARETGDSIPAQRQNLFCPIELEND